MNMLRSYLLHDEGAQREPRSRMLSKSFIFPHWFITEHWRSSHIALKLPPTWHSSARTDDRNVMFFWHHRTLKCLKLCFIRHRLLQICTLKSCCLLVVINPKHIVTFFIKHCISGCTILDFYPYAIFWIYLLIFSDPCCWYINMFFFPPHSHQENTSFFKEN